MQSADTLNTIISDKDLVPRLEPYLPRLIPILNECNIKIHIKLYFNFLLDFVKSYSDAIGESVIPFVESLVTRIVIELKSCHEKGEKNNIVINKCWNVLRVICESDSFMPRFAAQIENTMKPLFEYMADPSKVEFEDDIVLSVKSFLRKTGEVSPVMWTLYPYFQKVFDKNKHAFGNVLDTLNQYLVVARAQIAQSPDHMTLLVKMAGEALFGMQPVITIHNAEGAILLQLLFQTYAGTPALDPYYEEIMNLVRRRMVA